MYSVRFLIRVSVSIRTAAPDLVNSGVDNLIECLRFVRQASIRCRWASWQSLNGSGVAKIVLKNGGGGVIGSRLFKFDED